MPKVPKTTGLHYLCNMSMWRKMWRMKLIFYLLINVAGFFKVILSFYVCGRHPILPKITSLLLLYNNLRKKWVIFCMQISMKASFRLILWFWWKWSSIPKVPKRASLQCLRNISKNKLEMKMTFCMQIDISFLQVDFNALGIKVFYQVILSLFMSMI